MLCVVYLFNLLLVLFLPAVQRFKLTADYGRQKLLSLPYFSLVSVKVKTYGNENKRSNNWTETQTVKQKDKP